MNGAKPILPAAHGTHGTGVPVQHTTSRPQPVIIHVREQQEGRFLATSEDIPGLVVEEETQAAAMDEAGKLAPALWSANLGSWFDRDIWYIVEASGSSAAGSAELPRVETVEIEGDVPNEETAEILRRAARGEDVFYAKDADDLFRQLGL
jgi:hypothetical protein